jgi:isopentenyl-diphosphate Delta-isomerase
MSSCHSGGCSTRLLQMESGANMSVNTLPFLCYLYFILSGFYEFSRAVFKDRSFGLAISVDYIFFMIRDVKMNPNPEEVANVKYMNRDQLKELVRKADTGEYDVKLSPWFRLVVDNFLMSWWDHVEQGTLQEAAEMKTIHKL